MSKLERFLKDEPAHAFLEYFLWIWVLAVIVFNGIPHSSASIPSLLNHALLVLMGFLVLRGYHYRLSVIAFFFLLLTIFNIQALILGVFFVFLDFDAKTRGKLWRVSDSSIAFRGIEFLMVVSRVLFGVQFLFGAGSVLKGIVGLGFLIYYPVKQARFWILLLSCLTGFYSGLLDAFAIALLLLAPILYRDREKSETGAQVAFFYDGMCVYCNGFVRFILLQNFRDRVRVIALGSAEALRLGVTEHPDLAESAISMDRDGKLYFGAKSIFAVFRGLGYPWKSLDLAFNRSSFEFWVNPLYAFISRTRYRFRKEAEICELPTFFNPVFQKKENLQFRRAESNQVKLLFDWRNDPLTRAQSHQSELLEFDSHQKWFESSLTNPTREIYFVYDSEIPVGMIRRDQMQNAWMLSWMVNPEMRGKGYGSRLLHLFVRAFPAEYHAEIKEDNRGSIKMAIYAGFSKIESNAGILKFKYGVNA